MGSFQSWGSVFIFKKKKLRHSELDMLVLTGSLSLLSVYDMCACSHMSAYLWRQERCLPLPLLLPALFFHLFKEWQSSNWHMQRKYHKERNGSVGDRSLSKAPYSSVLRHLSRHNQTQNILTQLDCLASKFLEWVCLCLPGTEVVDLYPTVQLIHAQAFTTAWQTLYWLNHLPSPVARGSISHTLSLCGLWEPTVHVTQPFIPPLPPYFSHEGLAWERIKLKSIIVLFDIQFYIN